MTTIRIATRRSQLALWQTRWVAERIRAQAPDVTIEEVHVVTQGDRVTDKPLHMVGGKGLFVSEVESYVARGEADLAVHSLKDVPGDIDLAEGCDLVCLPEREDPRDVLLTRDGTDLMSLRAGARVGTVSPRRVCQLRGHRPDLAYETLRGNVPTRLGRLDAGDFDAIVLAAAGLRRLGLLADRPHQLLSTETCLPAVGQGTLAIEGRIDDERIQALLAPLEHGPTRLVTTAERAMLRRLQGSCRVPIAGFAELVDDGRHLRLRAMVGDPDSERRLSASSDVYLEGRDHGARVAEAQRLGEEVADALIDRGSTELMRQAEAASARRAKRLN